MSLAERALSTRHLSRLITHARHAAHGRLGLVPLLLLVSYAIGVTSVFARLPAPFAVDPAHSVISGVTPGSYVWVLGVRAGQSFETLHSESSDIGYAIDLGDGSSVSISDRYDIVGSDTLGVAALLFLYALVALRVGLPGAAVALGLSSAAALGPLGPALGYPINLPLAILPVLTITVFLANAVGNPYRRGLVWFGSLVTLAVSTLLVLATLYADVSWPWDVLWKMPAIAVLAIAAASLSSYLLAVTRAPSSRSERAHAILDAVFPIARSSRLTGSAEERRRIASEIHNVVLPSLGQAILELDADDPQGRARLAALVNELRGSLSERQTAVLERAGLLAAVRGYAASLRAHMDVVVTGAEEGRCRRDVEFAAYRVAQLALSNAVEHSGGDAVRIEISESRHELRVTVTDDGVGIDDEAENESLARGHLGLAEIRRTAAAVGAQLTIGAAVDRGTMVSFRYRR